MRFLLLPLLIFSVNTIFSQCKSYKLSSNGDTLNCVDFNDLKQGRWIITTPKLRGEPGFEAEGVFKNNRKEGLWRTFNLMGDLIAQENFKWGNKNGRCLYFTLAGLEREESWRAVNPDKAYDTLDVVDPGNPNQYERIVVKNDGNSIKHGIWKTYSPNTGALIETEEYIMGKLKAEIDAEKINSLAISKPLADTTKKQASKILPKEVLDFNKKQSKKNKPVVTGKTGN
jgi:antitoxin component YwqK of YwqJK toxin-antitoxin module